MAEILDGRAVSAQIRSEVSAGVKKLAAEGEHLGLTAVRVGEDPGAMAYGRTLRRASREVGIRYEFEGLPRGTSRSALRRKIEELNQDAHVHGVLVQEPLPEGLDPRAAWEAIAPEKDVDGLHPLNLGRLLAGRPRLIPATPKAVQELLLRSGHPPRGKHVVIVGRGEVVGKPLAALLVQKNPEADATVTICHSHTTDLQRHTRAADILVVAVGRPEFLGREMVQEGAVVVDVGINSVPDPGRPGSRKLVGDVAFNEVAPLARAISPVPGGVGPVTVAVLLRNALEGYRLQTRGPSRS